MAVHASPETLADVIALLCPVNGKTPREIKQALPLTGSGAVYSALYLLVKAGRVMAEGEMCKRRYRLVGERA
jgi:hypothetical protein